ncbi:hypothetical protein K435DRAFT_748130 [Dendrothele bispora CBS 962.96]|uniref:Calcofluor white hypersensitive protein n=1 Tax=Dendrothele bispora (strain CBS 962.96) TaxID=1314807 RepID=A0A4S8MKP1_DENBC|nr:hypothetical protein K435DRAFT_748130 [Dendrothele bispora CBS 962.96]
MAAERPMSSPINLTLKASTIARLHTLLAYTAFTVALLLGLLLHYKKIVKNSVAGYPQEWFPSVSATIGDWYPERSVFQILIALTSGPRFGLVILSYLQHQSSQSTLPNVVFICGVLRTLFCGGWVYITSNDDHDIHDFFMIGYIVLNLPWMIGGVLTTPLERKVVREKRIFVASAFFITLVPLVYFFIQHKVYRIPGAYTRYSFFEWSLIILDVLYDAHTERELEETNMQLTISFNVPMGTTAPARDQRNASQESSPVQLEKPNKTTSVVADASATTSATPVIPDMLKELGPYTSFCSDLYLAYIFWSIFTALTPTLFYFSIWELGIAGHELALLSTLAPILLLSPFFSSWAHTRGGLTTLHLFSFSGLAAYALEKPIHRLLVVGFANLAVVLSQVVKWRQDAQYESIITALGLLLSSALKHANHSNNPVWPFVNEKSGGYNKIGILLALLSLYEFHFRQSSANHSREKKKQEVLGHWFTGALPLGSLIFISHSLLSDPSVLISWSWTGYENSQPRGPVPNLHGPLTLVAQSLGLLLAVHSLKNPSNVTSRVLSHPLWFLFGGICSFIMYRWRNWPGYSGGLGFAIFVMSSFPYIFGNAADNGSLAGTSLTAMLVYCLLSLASVWTVAYAFVPGGVYLRERSDLIIIGQMVCLLPAFSLHASNHPRFFSAISSSVSSYSRTTLTCISVFALLTTLYRLPDSPRPFRPGPRILRAGIWTLHFGIDNAGRDSQRRVRDVIRDLELDVVGFLETDLYRTVFGNRDLTRVITEEMGYHVDIGPGPNSHTWGAVLLSKFPIINSTHHLLPSPHGELAPAIEAILDVYGLPITVIVAHNGQEEDPLDRELQSKELARIMASSYPKPVIFLGYIVSKPHAPRPAPYQILVEDGKMHDIDDEDPNRWCEYILYRGLYRTSYARVSRGTITDTELQVGQFLLPKHGYGVMNDTREARYLRAFKEELSPMHWFPMEYYGNKKSGGVNGHFYHVFNTPLYYKLPQEEMV